MPELALDMIEVGESSGAPLGANVEQRGGIFMKKRSAFG